MMKGKCSGCKVFSWLVIIGGINWGLVGFFEWNLVSALFGSMPLLERVIYMIVGISALIMLASMCGKCGKCKK